MTDTRAAAERLTETIRQRLAKWRAWFPSDNSMVEVSRGELLALAECADAYLAMTQADDEEPPKLTTYEIRPCVHLRIGVAGIGRIGAFMENWPSKEFLLRDVTNKGQVRRLLAALGVDKENAG